MPLRAVSTELAGAEARVPLRCAESSAKLWHDLCGLLPGESSAKSVVMKHHVMCPWESVLGPNNTFVRVWGVLGTCTQGLPQRVRLIHTESRGVFLCVVLCETWCQWMLVQAVLHFTNIFLSRVESVKDLWKTLVATDITQLGHEATSASALLSSRVRIGWLFQWFME